MPFWKKFPQCILQIVCSEHQHINLERLQWILTFDHLNLISPSMSPTTVLTVFIKYLEIMYVVIWHHTNYIELNWIELNWIELNWIELNWIEHTFVECPAMRSGDIMFTIMGWTTRQHIMPLAPRDQQWMKLWGMNKLTEKWITSLVMALSLLKAELLCSVFVRFMIVVS